MLQVKHLVKRYVAKGETVTALDDVTVDFPEKGMVFLLGKSGSGKSTLLNVSGGLDAPDDGEVIVNGKSSKNFSVSDFDSYRNTYLGFIFQEYNILAELTVAENVALALELQGKPNDPERVAELLAQVDLTGYGDRRPNTLSGGQKQRVAIARALVKDPEIIMADEPTGALDSKTGAQVFDTLKKLSAEKLVVVVSHDREFAEVYADRIIELKDGKIISDVTRTAEEREEARRNYFELTEKKIAFASGAALTDEEEKKAVEFIRKHKGAVVLSAEEEDADTLPRTGRAVFRDTDAAELPVPEDDGAKFIRSRFPFRYAFKMGVSGLRLKPVRLAFTTLLATIAFIVFGVFSTLITYDTTKIGRKTLASSSYGAAVLERHGVAVVENSAGKVVSVDIDTGAGRSHFSQAEIDELRTKTAARFVPAFNLNITRLDFSGNQSRSGARNYYYEAFTYFTAFTHMKEVTPFFDDGTFTMLAGDMPQSDGEVVVSRAVFESFKQYGHAGHVDEEGNKVPIEEYDDLLGLGINISASASTTLHLSISGVYDAHEDFSAYSDLAEVDEEALTADDLTAVRDRMNELSDVFRYSMSSLCIVKDNFYEEHKAADIYTGTETENPGGRRTVSLDPVGFRSSNFVTRVGNERWAFFIINEASEPAGSYVQYLFAPLGGARGAVSSAVMKLDKQDNRDLGVDYRTPYLFMKDIRSNETAFGQIIVILGPAAAVLAVFSALLLFNFISASINAKKRDIGILRAVGARGIDVFKIFIVEGAAITLFCFGLGSLGAFLVCMLINPVLIEANLLTFGMFYFDWLNALIVFAIAAVTALFSTAVPVAVTAHKRPVEAIRSI